MNSLQLSESDPETLVPAVNSSSLHKDRRFDGPNAAYGNASILIPLQSEPPGSPAPSLLGKRSRSQSPNTEYVHDLALHAAALSSSHETDSAKRDFFDPYGPSSFGGWGEYMARKRAKLQNQNVVLQEARTDKPQFFRGTQAYVRYQPRSVIVRDTLNPTP